MRASVLDKARRWPIFVWFSPKGASMTKACFICGIGTDVGKSVVCAGLLRNIAKGRAIKIVQTGPALSDQKLYAEACPRHQVSTLRHFRLAASPHLAAEAENQVIDLGLLAQEIRTEALKAEWTLLEGSGGILTPLSASETFLDLMITLDYPVILVVGNVLGAINHALLSLSALKNAGLKLAGLIFTHPDPDYREDHPIAADNIQSIQRLGRTDVLGVVPHLAGLARKKRGMAVWGRVGDSLSQAAGRLLASGRGAETPEEDIAGFDQQHLWHPYCPAPGNCEPNWTVERTAGNYIYLQNGRKLLDGMSSWWCAVHGYGRPEMIAALNMQAHKMAHVMFGGLTHEPAAALGRSLLKLLPPGLEKIFWADSGSVAVEVALKMAVQYWQGCGRPDKNRFISHYGGYHGDTLGAMSVSDPVNGMHAGFKGFVPEQLFVPRPASPFAAPFDEGSLRTLAETAARHQQQCAAVIIEPVVQGAGGMWFYHPGYLRGVWELCRRHDLLLICDEIATGFGRTGKMFASEWAGLSPDILCLGKALTGGAMTLAAAVCTREVAEGLSRDKRPLMHGPTFMANPLACRVAQASLDLLQASPWAERVQAVQGALEAGLAGCRRQARVHDVRVLGAIGVVEMKQPVNAARLRKYFAEKHEVWIRPFNRLIYVMPPYAVTADETARLCLAIREAIEGEEWA
ncbi:MAG: adenosylmethionine--8-amino-7-oxononanoate transaminase [Deltaproteobacteria bacterium]|jgi:adenosylmethionine-8-amino-7-oxononanoate aminotransferase|nr:adenosylmethionine--8-amino-7-oxononanoate transaminase [Deltaproteobacteria bacterium]